MKAHERFSAAARGQKVDRLPMIEWATWWDKTIANWHTEKPNLGLNSMSRSQLYTHFGLDVNLQKWFRLTTAKTPKPKSHGAPIVTNMSEYEMIRDTLYPAPVLDSEFIREAKTLHENGNGIVWFTFEGFFWFPRVLLGIENHLFSFYDEPELYHRICSDLLDWQIKSLDILANTVKFDFMTFGEDMSYNLGPMISHDLFDEFMAPYYRKIVPLVKQAEILTVVDSDGDITHAVDWFADVGIEGMLPLERQAGVDISLYQQKHPEMFFIGHYDKMVMSHGESAMRAEFERLLPSIKRGKFIPSVDHQTPPGVSYENYQIYLKLLAEYCGK